MKWTKLEYGNWPKGEIVLKINFPEGQRHEVGTIHRNETTQVVYFYCLRLMQLYAITIDSIYDTEPYFIRLEDLEMPE